tara:strand:+ start:284 stop:451 length:168 start_codon:yes stop_codon:yes gene_type:complete
VANQIGNYSLYIALFASIFLIFQSSISIRNNSKNLDSKIFSSIISSIFDDYYKFF